MVHAEGFSDECVAVYSDRKFRRCNPIPSIVMANAKPMFFSTVRSLASQTDPQVAGFFQAMEEHGLGHGLGIPLFGPRNQDAYACFGFDPDVELVWGERLDALCGIMQAAHQRICNLNASSVSRPRLSDRERQIIFWAAHGKSNVDIAAILSLSEGTVGTYVKRVFDKLGVRDRVSASIKALQLGIIVLDDSELKAA